jgi:sarcosine oxidase
MLESDSKEQVVLKTGGLDLGPRNGAIPLSTYSESMDACGVPYEALDHREIMRRWPQFRLTEEVHGLYQEESGIAMAARANAAHQRMAREHGATLRDRAPITSIRSARGEVDVTAGGVSYRCRKLIIAAGPWSNDALGHFGITLPLQVTQEQVSYFSSPHRREFEPGRFPVWIWMDDPCYYGFPVFGEAATKAAQDAGGKPVTADTRSFEPDPANTAGVVDFLAKYLPAALGPVLYTKTCLYTLTPDRDFVIDTVPETDNVHIAIGAGHAFKFASVIGRTLSELAITGRTDADISPFTITRPILQEKNPATSYMV